MGGKEDNCMAFPGGAKTRSKIPTRPGKWEVGPLYRLSHSARECWRQGGLGQAAAAKAAMGGRLHPWVWLVSGSWVANPSP